GASGDLQDRTSANTLDQPISELSKLVASPRNPINLVVFGSTMAVVFLHRHLLIFANGLHTLHVRSAGGACSWAIGRHRQHQPVQAKGGGHSFVLPSILMRR